VEGRGTHDPVSISLPRIRVIIPTLNEEKSIGDVIRRCKIALASYEYEIIVVDGSKDKTSEIACRMGTTLVREKGRGYGAAYLTGFEYAMRKEDDAIIVMIDADSTYAPEEIPSLVAPILKGEADLTLANRFADMDPNAMSLRNRIGNRVISWFVSKLYGIEITDSQTGFRAVSSACLRRMFLETKGMPLATEMLIEARKLGVRIVEVSTSYHPRIGDSKIRAMHDGYGILWTSLRLVSDLDPFVIYGRLGALFCLLGIGFGTYAIMGWYQWYFLGANTWPRLGSALLSVLFFVGGAVIFGLGILLDSLLRYMRAAAYRERICMTH
jgi:glycosyltransferase involved in cell wall biosynthesis